MKERNAKLLVRVLTVLLVVVAIASIASNVMAATGAKDPSKITGTATTAFDTIGGKIVGMLQSIGSIASVAVLVILGVKYMMGSTEEKAEYKKTMIPYIIGAILIFAASNIAGMVFKFANDLK